MRSGEGMGSRCLEVPPPSCQGTQRAGASPAWWTAPVGGPPAPPAHQVRPISGLPIKVKVLAEMWEQGHPGAEVRAAWQSAWSGRGGRSRAAQASGRAPPSTGSPRRQGVSRRSRAGSTARPGTPTRASTAPLHCVQTGYVSSDLLDLHLHQHELDGQHEQHQDLPEGGGCQGAVCDLKEKSLNLRTEGREDPH